MKTTNLLTACLAAGILGQTAGSAQIAFTVTTGIAPLAGNPAGPFTLDFQLVDGSGLGDANNQVTLGNFRVAGGTWTGPASITLTDNAFLVESTKSFTAGTSLSFDVSMTTSVDAGGTPDQFSFGILDGGSKEIPTLGVGDALVSVNIDSANPSVDTFRSDLSRTGIDIAAPTIAPVPEPMSALAAGAALLAGASLRRWLRPQGRA